MDHAEAYRFPCARGPTGTWMMPPTGVVLCQATDVAWPVPNWRD